MSGHWYRGLVQGTGTEDLLLELCEQIRLSQYHTPISTDLNYCTPQLVCAQHLDVTWGDVISVINKGDVISVNSEGDVISVNSEYKL